MNTPDRTTPPQTNGRISDSDDDGAVRVELPRPVVAKTRWPFPLVWVVPVLAAIAAGYYLYGIYKDRGVEIAIAFNDASNIRVRDTPLNYHGVRVGSVSRIDLNDDRTRAMVHVRLDRAYQNTIARDGGQFWLVRPDAAGGMLSGLSTVITGPYIDCAPGAGDANYYFNGFDSRPPLMGDGVRVVLRTDRLAHLEVRSPVFFRGLQVGLIQDIRFSSDARGVNITAFIWKRYSKLLRGGSRFWEVSGTDIKGGVFSGVSVEINNTRALFSGAVAFATNDESDNNGKAKDGDEYVLHDAPDKEWLNWTAKIDLTTDENPGQPEPGPMPRVNVP